MTTVEINVLCDGRNCDDILTTEPIRSFDAGVAYNMVQRHGWEIRITRAGRIRTLCPKCRRPTK